jgi:protoporphyrinogen oxidase
MIGLPERSGSFTINHRGGVVGKDLSIVVLGAGPAGLTAAYELAKQGISSVVLEKENKVGGISRTETYKDYRFDIGGHRFFTKVEAVKQFWYEIMGD